MTESEFLCPISAIVRRGDALRVCKMRLKIALIWKNDTFFMKICSFGLDIQKLYILLQNQSVVFVHYSQLLLIHEISFIFTCIRPVGRWLELFGGIAGLSGG